MAYSKHMRIGLGYLTSYHCYKHVWITWKVSRLLPQAKIAWQLVDISQDTPEGIGMCLA